MSIENIEIVEHNGERLFEFSICADHRDQEIPIWQKKVFEKFNRKINQLWFPFGQLGLSHGQVIDWIVGNTKDMNIDYYMMWENDSIPLRRDYFDIVYDKIKDKETIMGSAQQSNHKIKYDGTLNHPYCATPFSISTKLYNKLGRPSFDHHVPRSDTYEEIAFKAEELGYNICIVWPRETVGLTEEQMKILGPGATHKSPIGQGRFGGFGSTFGNNLWYHQYFPPVKEHAEVFIRKCQEVLEKKQ